MAEAALLRSPPGTSNPSIRNRSEFKPESFDIAVGNLRKRNLSIRAEARTDGGQKATAWFPLREPQFVSALSPPGFR